MGTDRSPALTGPSVSERRDRRAGVAVGWGGVGWGGGGGEAGLWSMAGSAGCCASLPRPQHPADG